MKHTKELFQRFEEVFGYSSENLYFSPGRINLIGEHTDYNGGKVFPCAITMGTYGIVSPREDKMVYAFSDNLPELGTLSFSLEDITYEKEDNWTNYVKGMLLYIQEKLGEFSHGFDLFIYGTIPNGASLSSSASLEVLTGVIANDLYQANLSGETIAKLGMRVENEFLNLNSGIMDQFIIANAKKGHALLLDTNTLEYEQIPLNLPDHKIVIMNSLTRRELVDSEYNTRREQCEKALEMLQKVVSISSLGELSESEFEEYKYAITDSVLARRAKHAVYENVRTEKAAEALRNNQLEAFGQLMNESHLSLHEDYEVTVKETDFLVRSAWRQEGVLGARMTGGGFGGCCIAIVENDEVDSFIDHVGADYEEEIGFLPEFYIAETEDGAQKI
ncbi:MAG TPA: galactokinase [Candidatus Atopostipes pullistercoris]|uniref:Galactokinase n=1 Tax=Candidatus Atopostipes pullistercoris TaxID=2838467 RepID=A0A9D2FZW7_9LACT|nr:galactokinase [Candidatus Atopostipes pullistercoris]